MRGAAPNWLAKDAKCLSLVSQKVKWPVSKLEAELLDESCSSLLWWCNYVSRAARYKLPTEEEGQLILCSAMFMAWQPDCRLLLLLLWTNVALFSLQISSLKLSVANTRTRAARASISQLPIG